jgi:hypothetical protein
MGLYGEQNTPFPCLLVFSTDEKESTQMRHLHIKLRCSFRNNAQAHEIFNMIAQMKVQRNRILSTFSKLNEMNA